MDSIEFLSALVNAGVAGTVFFGCAVMITAHWLF
jgi:hypothetical protein